MAKMLNVLISPPMTKEHKYNKNYVDVIGLVSNVTSGMVLDTISARHKLQ